MSPPAFPLGPPQSGAKLAVALAALAAAASALVLVPGEEAPALDVEALSPLLLGLTAFFLLLAFPVARAGRPAAGAGAALLEAAGLLLVVLPALLVAAFFSTADGAGLGRALVALGAEAAVGVGAAVALGRRVAGGPGRGDGAGAGAGAGAGDRGTRAWEGAGWAGRLYVAIAALLFFAVPLVRFAALDAFGRDLEWLAYLSPGDLPAAVSRDAGPGPSPSARAVVPTALPERRVRIESPTDGYYRRGRIAPLRVPAPAAGRAIWTAEPGGVRYVVAGDRSLLRSVIHGGTGPAHLLGGPDPLAPPDERLVPESPVEWRAVAERDVLVAVAAGSTLEARERLGPGPVLARVDIRGLALADLEAFDALVVDRPESELSRAFAARGGLVLSRGESAPAAVERLAEARRRAADLAPSDPAVDPRFYDVFEPVVWPRGLRERLAGATALSALAVLLAALFPRRVRAFAPALAGLLATVAVSAVSLPESRAVTTRRDVYRLRPGAPVAAREAWIEVASPAAVRERVDLPLDPDGPAKAILYDLPDPAPCAVLERPSGLVLRGVPVGAGERRIFTRLSTAPLAGPLDVSADAAGLRLVNRTGRDFTDGLLISPRAVVPLGSLEDGATRAIAPSAPSSSFVEYGIRLESLGRQGRERKATLLRLLRGANLGRVRLLVLFDAAGGAWLVPVEP